MKSHLTGFSKQFASQTDACLLVQGEQFPVHRAFLTYASTVFCDLFGAAEAENLAAGKSREDKICVTMAGHTIEDTSIALDFIYKRVLGFIAPSKQLWQSIDQARPVIEFAHKFDMKCILEEADTCLSQDVQVADGQWLFDDVDAIVAWANLANDYCLKKLLSEVELVMLKCDKTELWQRSPSATHQVPQACQLRVLRAAQQDRAAFKADLSSGSSRAYGVKHVSSSTLLSWQEDSSNKELA